jgi:predicted transposase YdaD
MPQLLCVSEDSSPYVPNPTTRHIHDSGYKHLLSNKVTFLQFMRRFVPSTLVDTMDDIEMLSMNPEFVKADFSKTTSDLIYRVRNQSKRTFYFVLLELQSTVDSKMGLRFFGSMMEQWRRSILEMSSSDSALTNCALPMIVPIVLYNGKPPWHNTQTVMLEFYRVNSPEPLSVNIEYVLIDVHRLNESILMSTSDVISSAFYLDQTIDNDPQETISRLRLIANQMRTFNDDQYEIFIIWLNVMLRARIGANQDEINHIFQQTERGEETAMVEKVQNAWQKHLDEARNAGMQEGKFEGKIEGKLEGIHVGKKELALQLLQSGVIDITTISKATGIPEDEIRAWMQ